MPTQVLDEQSVRAAEAAVHANPHDAERHVDVGMAYFHSRRLDEAMAAFDQALALDPDSARAYNGKGRVLYHTGPPEQAAAAYRNAFELDRHYVDAYFGLGILYAAQLGEYIAALEAFQLGLKHNPSDVFLRTSLGTTYARMGRFDTAIATLEEVLALDPTSTYALGWLSMIYLHQQRYDEMIVSCEREIAIEDGHDARRMLGYVYIHRGQLDAAIDQLERSIALEPDDYEARAALSRAYRLAGRPQQAAEHYAMAQAQAAQDNEYGRACFEAVSGNHEAALALLEIARAEGQLTAGWMQIDPEFAFLTDDPRFQALLKGRP